MALPPSEGGLSLYYGTPPPSEGGGLKPRVQYPLGGGSVRVGEGVGETTFDAESKYHIIFCSASFKILFKSVKFRGLSCSVTEI